MGTGSVVAATTRTATTRTATQRQTECTQITTQLQELGLSPEITGIRDFHAIMQRFVHEGLSCSGEIKLPGLKRVLCYVLSTRCHVACTVNLRYDAALG